LTKSPTMIYTGMLNWSLAYAPTISLTNSLAFSHLKDPEKDYSLIRTFGTIGWIASNWILGLWRDSGMKIGGEDCLYLAAAAAVIMGLFCFILPHTPPAKSGVSPFAFARAFSLLLNPRILVFLIVSFVAATILWFYFPMIGPFLGDLGVSAENSPKIQSLGPIFEILAMLSLPWLLKRYGPRKLLILGMAAFAIRNLVFVIGWPTALVAASCALHGPSFAFFFVVGFIFIDAAAPKDIKGSAQGLLGLVVFGLGAWLGTMIAFKVKAFYTVTAEATAAGAATEVVQWSKFFLVPMILAVVCAAVFMLTFPKGSMKDAAGKPEAAAAEGEKPAGQPPAPADLA